MREKFLLLIFVVAFPLVAYVSTFPPQRFRNDITEWGNHQSETYQDFLRYRDQFGINNYFVVTWPGCDLNDPRVEKVSEKIETELADRVQQVSNGQRIYWDLRDRIGLSDKIALRRLRENFISETGLETAVGFNLTKDGRLDRAGVVDELHVILKSSGIDPASASFAGLGHNLYTLDKEGLESPFRMVRQCVGDLHGMSFVQFYLLGRYRYERDHLAASDADHAVVGFFFTAFSELLSSCCRDLVGEERTESRCRWCWPTFNLE